MAFHRDPVIIRPAIIRRYFIRRLLDSAVSDFAGR
jgi:hypothetical protein